MTRADSGTGLRRVCVFCGSSLGARPAYAAATRNLAERLARRGIGLVYGGASVGLMGVLANAALAAGGEVVGVIPRALVEREIPHDGLADLRVVGTMHERKALMNELSDAFVALPGGMGTLDELAEALTWGQLGIHAKPVGLLDVDGFFGTLLAFADRAVEDGFVRPEHRSALLVESDPDALIDGLQRHQPARVKWAGERPSP